MWSTALIAAKSWTDSSRPARPDDPELDDPNVAGVLMQRIKRLNNYQKGDILEVALHKGKILIERHTELEATT